MAGMMDFMEETSGSTNAGESRSARTSLRELRARRRTAGGDDDGDAVAETRAERSSRRLGGGTLDHRKRPLRVSQQIGGGGGGGYEEISSRGCELGGGGGGDTMSEASAGDESKQGRFNKDAVLDADADLIKQLTQRTDDLRERMGREGRSNALGRPKPVPKVTPYRKPLSTPGTAASSPTKVAEGDEEGKKQSADGGVSTGASTTVCGSACSSRPTTAGGGVAMATADSGLPSPRAQGGESLGNTTASSSAATTAEDGEAVHGGGASSKGQLNLNMDPVVPQAGTLFSAGDIDDIMNKMMPSSPAAGPEAPKAPGGGGDAAGGCGTTTSGKPRFQRASIAKLGERRRERDAALERTQNAGSASLARDLMEDIGVPLMAGAPCGAAAEDSSSALWAAAPAEPPLEKKDFFCFSEEKDFLVPDRKDLRDQIASIDSLLSGDFRDRDSMAGAQKLAQDMLRNPQMSAAGLAPTPASMFLTRDPTMAEPGSSLGGSFLQGGAGEGSTEGQDEKEVFSLLLETKRAKARGLAPSGSDLAKLKLIAQKAKPLAPRMSLEGLVRMLKLFASARYVEPDLYLRILGEIPMQMKTMTPELLVRAVGILRRLRMRESTYMELFASEAMNMIRGASRKPFVSKPKLPSKPKPRHPPAEGGEQQQQGEEQQKPAGAAESSAEGLGPFTPLQLVKLGNGFCLLDAKHQSRFVDIFQEQLQKAIPRMTREECEMVHPCLALSALVNDPLRRVFLERCATVGAGFLDDGAASQQQPTPDIPTFQAQKSAQKQRMRHIKNIYALEASVRKETFSFYSSLPPEVRTYLEGLKERAGKLPAEEPNRLTLQVAEILGQLGVQYSLERKSGPVSLHIVAQGTNPYNGEKERVYECDDVEAYYARKEGDKEEPVILAATKQRHRLLERMGTHLTHISTWEWQKLGQAQRVNYIVKLHSLAGTSM